MDSTVCCTRRPTVVKIMKAVVHYEINIIECLGNGSCTARRKRNIMIISQFNYYLLTNNLIVLNLSLT